ncbi:MAG TPA: hypothetical protein VNV85_11815 [Puia sp.]|jgi:hypothetical protein|nr:hypothetical protein [Puia sp.]
MSKIFLFLLLNILSLILLAQDKPLQICGGQSHKIYLGCLNCDNVQSNSIWNDVGDFGSDVSDLSIWNDIGDYGSDISDFSPWNDIAS